VRWQFIRGSRTCCFLPVKTTRSSVVIANKLCCVTYLNKIKFEFSAVRMFFPVLLPAQKSIELQSLSMTATASQTSAPAVVDLSCFLSVMTAYNRKKNKYSTGAV